jgi:hypothetical protein
MFNPLVKRGFDKVGLTQTEADARYLSKTADDTTTYKLTVGSFTDSKSGAGSTGSVNVFGTRKIIPNSDNSYDCGDATHRYRDVFISRNLSDGTNVATIAQAKTAYDHSQTAHAPSDAEANNISDADATDLTDGGETTLHKHDGRYVDPFQIIIENPTDAEKWPFYVSRNITITSITLVNEDGTSCTGNVEKRTAPNTTGNKIVTSDFASSSSGVTKTHADFNDTHEHLSAGNWLCPITSAVNGSVKKLTYVIAYTVD